MNASILFIFPILYFEGGIIYKDSAIFASLAFWIAMNIAGLFGFLIGIVTIIQV